MNGVAVGTTGESVYDTVAADSAEAVGNTGVYVVSSQALVRFIEKACADVIAGNLEAGEQTVGVGFHLEHVAPARIGTRIAIRSTVRSVDGRLVLFDVTALDGERPLMTGTHSRAAIDLDRFMAKYRD